jgi:hypothetical protein
MALDRGVAGKKRDKIESKQLEGLKYFQKVRQLAQRLHGAGCERDRAHNRELFMDQYVLLLLLYMFNPICVSLRALQQASELKKVQKVLGVSRSSLGSLSEASRVFDSRLLVGLIQDLGAELKPLPHDARLDDLGGSIVTLTDGTVLKALPKVASALGLDGSGPAFKAHVEFEVLKGVPVAATLTEAHGDERKVLEGNLRSGRLYVDDRAYGAYWLLQKILDAGSHFVTRLKDNAAFEVVQERELSAEALQAGVVRDAVVHLGSSRTRDKLRQAVRIVEVECRPHLKSRKTGRGGPEQGDTILIVTDLLDVPPEVVSLIYQHRWQIETFFRTFKHLLGCRHLLSQCQNGIELQVYMAILACLLIALYTGRKPTQRTYEMLAWHFMGWADEDELAAHIAKLKKQD